MDTTQAVNLDKLTTEQLRLLKDKGAEAICSNYGGHLGHVFDAGPKDTPGLHFCINSFSLGFKPEKDRKLSV